MLSTFNCGVGFILVLPMNKKDDVITYIKKYYGCYEIGHIESGDKKIIFENKLDWLHHYSPEFGDKIFLGNYFRD